jgi:hypothetical protein
LNPGHACPGRGLTLEFRNGIQQPQQPICQASGFCGLLPCGHLRVRSFAARTCGTLPAVQVVEIRYRDALARHPIRQSGLQVHLMMQFAGAQVYLRLPGKKRLGEKPVTFFRLGMTIHRSTGDGGWANKPTPPPRPIDSGLRLDDNLGPREPWENLARLSEQGWRGKRLDTHLLQTDGKPDQRRTC